MHVTNQVGESYTVSRRWLPWRRRVNSEAADSPSVDLFDVADDPISLLIAALAFVLFLPLVLLLILGLLEILVLLALLPFVLAARSLLGVPWVLEVREGNSRFSGEVVHSEKIAGWRASSERIAALATEYGTTPR